MTLLNDITGRNNHNSGMNIFLQTPHNVVHALGNLALMERAVWASMMEPVVAGMVTRTAGAGFATLGRSIGQLMGTASARDRTALAEFLGVITTPMHDTAMLSRLGADYSDSPRMERLLSNFFKATFLSQVTNGQRAAAVGTGNWFLHKLSQHYLDTSDGGRKARYNAERWFREFDIPDSVHQRFAEWMTNDLKGSLPTPEMLKDISHGMGDIYALGVSRLVDRIIQDPKKVDRSMLADTPIIGLAWQLMSFNYSFKENVLIPAARAIQTSFTYTRDEARKAGKATANLHGLLGATGTGVNLAAIAATMVGAQFMQVVVRQLIYAQDQWKKHSEDGTLLSWLGRLAISRSGLYGTWDPLQQALNHYKYDSDLSALSRGASINTYTGNLHNVLMPLFGTNSPTTNTAEYNQMKGLYNLIGVPAGAMALSALGTMGPGSRVLAGSAMQFLTAPTVADKVASWWAGPKGVTLPKGGGGDDLDDLSSGSWRA